jgi:hypothetical protein
VLLMSGYSEYSGGVKDPALAHIPIIQKPFSRPALVRKIREVLLGQSAEPARALNNV